MKPQRRLGEQAGNLRFKAVLNIPMMPVKTLAQPNGMLAFDASKVKTPGRWAAEFRSKPESKPETCQLTAEAGGLQIEMPFTTWKSALDLTSKVLSFGLEADGPQFLVITVEKGADLFLLFERLKEERSPLLQEVEREAGTYELMIHGNTKNCIAGNVDSAARAGVVFEATTFLEFEVVRRVTIVLFTRRGEHLLGLIQEFDDWIGLVPRKTRKKRTR